MITIYQFDVMVYSLDDINDISKEQCEYYANYDSANVTKFEYKSATFQDILNSCDDIYGLNVANCVFRVFTE